MPIRDLMYRIRARDESEEGAAETERTLGGTFGRLAAAAAAVGAALAEGVASAALDAEDRLRTLIRSTGQDTALQEQVFISLLERGTTEDNARTAISALTGQGQAVGVGLGDTAVARLLADYSTIGGSPAALLETLAQFGVSGAEDVYARGNIIGAAALDVGQQPRDVTQQLRNYGPILGQAGFSDLESLALITDLNQQGIDIRRVGPGINTFLRGGGNRAGLEDIQARVIGASSDEEALQIATEAFGAEGAIRLSRALRSGGAGFGAEDLSLAHLTGSLNLASVAEATGREAFESSIAASGQAGGFRRVAAALSASDVPLVGGVVGTIGGIATSTDRAGAGTLGDIEATFAVLLEHERLLLGLLEGQAGNREVERRNGDRSGLDIAG